MCRSKHFFSGSRSSIGSNKLSATNLSSFLWSHVIWPVQYTIFWYDTGRLTPPDKILSRGVSLIVAPSPWKWSPYMSALFSNLSHWLLIWLYKHLSNNVPLVVYLPVSLYYLETFLASLTISLNVSSSIIQDLIPLLKMFIPINEVALDSAVENILPEVTYTIDSIDNPTPWSLNVSVWCLFFNSYW